MMAVAVVPVLEQNNHVIDGVCAKGVKIYMVKEVPLKVILALGSHF